LPKLVSVVVAIVAVVGAAGLGLERGWWRLNHPDPREFPTWGIDVSHHQGAVNWPLVATEPHIRFAYLKATEGSDWTNVVLYVTVDAYDAFLKDGRIHNPLWIRNIWTQPPQASWVLWQFANRGHLRGIAGAVDLNVLREASRDIPSNPR
jgi:GH25 family lysozyme M1 (1,4-beta-N-acetylmuramidase)